MSKLLLERHTLVSNWKDLLWQIAGFQNLLHSIFRAQVQVFKVLFVPARKAVEAVLRGMDAVQEVSELSVMRCSGDLLDDTD